MGVKGLLPALQSIQTRGSLREFSNQKLAIDGYAWLHRAAFAAREAVVMGKSTNKPNEFCLRKCRLLRDFNVEPMLVFDGRSLPSKAETNATRREARNTAKAKAVALKDAGDHSGAFRIMGQAISITTEMVKSLISACRKSGIQCLIAPYEADAQLGYLSHTNQVAGVITEDSDLLLYGCKVCLFKMDDTGGCIIVRNQDLPKANLLKPFTEDALIILACMVGCDYIPPIKGVGLKKGAQILQKVVTHGKENQDIDLKLLELELKLKGFNVPENYQNDLKRAWWTYKSQTVYDPQTKSLTRRIEYPADLETMSISFGPLFDDPESVCSDDCSSKKRRLSSPEKRPSKIRSIIHSNIDPRQCKLFSTNNKVLLTRQPKVSKTSQLQIDIEDTKIAQVEIKNMNIHDTQSITQIVNMSNDNIDDEIRNQTDIENYHNIDTEDKLIKIDEKIINVDIDSILLNGSSQNNNNYSSSSYSDSKKKSQIVQDPGEDNIRYQSSIHQDLEHQDLEHQDLVHQDRIENDSQMTTSTDINNSLDTFFSDHICDGASPPPPPLPKHFPFKSRF